MKHLEGVQYRPYARLNVILGVSSGRVEVCGRRSARHKVGVGRRPKAWQSSDLIIGSASSNLQKRCMDDQTAEEVVESVSEMQLHGDSYSQPRRTAKLQAKALRAH